MDYRTWSVLLVVLIPVVSALWRSSEEKRPGFRRDQHFHTKRHMIPSPSAEDQKLKRRRTFQKPKEGRKKMNSKPSGHLKPLDEDDMENDEVVSVAVGPPPIRPKYDKVNWRLSKSRNNTPSTNVTGTNLVKDVLVQLGREFLTHQVSEDFVFGQYIGNAMRNLTGELRLKMQHEVLELVMKYQRVNRGELKFEDLKDKKDKLDKNEKSDKIDKALAISIFKDYSKTDKRAIANETEDNWPDFSNLAKIVG